MAVPANATAPGENGKLAFTKLSKNGSADIFVSNLNGKKRINITKKIRGSQFNPNWSPGGRALVFYSEQGGNASGPIFKLYIHELTKRQLQNAAGGKKKKKKPPTRQLTKGKGSDTSGSFCGEKVIFVRKIGQKSDLYLIASNGKGLRRLTRTAVAESSPMCSADGQWVYYARETSAGSFSFEVVRQRLKTNGKALQGPVEVLVGGDSFDLSPDGTTLIYPATDPVDFNSEIFLRDLTRTDATPVQMTFSESGVSNFNPRFTPNFGRELAARVLSGGDIKYEFTYTQVTIDGDESVVEVVDATWVAEGEREADEREEEIRRLKASEGTVARRPTSAVKSYFYRKITDSDLGDVGYVVEASKWWIVGTASKKDNVRVELAGDGTVTVSVSGKKKFSRKVDFSSGFKMCFDALRRSELTFIGFNFGDALGQKFEQTRSATGVVELGVVAEPEPIR